MEEYVKDTIIGNEYDDLALFRLVDLTVSDIQGNRPLFPSLLDEPAFYRRYFRRWVREALDEKQAIDQGMNRTELRFRSPFEEENGV